MSITKEVRIGILVTVALVIFFTGFYFLKGSDLFSNDKEYFCYYPDVDGLLKSSNVEVEGLVVGHVSNMALAGERGVKVTLSINKKINVPAGTISSLASADLLGTKIIKLQPGRGPDMQPAGTELATTKDAGVVDNLTNELTPRLAELKVTIASFNKTLDNVNNVMGDQNQKAIAAAIGSLQGAARNMEQVTQALSSETGEIKDVIHNAKSVTGNLAANNDTVQRILANMSSVTRQLANAPIQQTVTDLQQTSAQLQGIMNKINTNQGTLGMLINDKETYNYLNSTLKSLNNLADDLKVHPSRYVNISVFGHKRND